MGIMLDEQETVVQFDRTGQNMTIYTSDSTMITKLDKIYSRVKEHKQSGEIMAVEYVADKRLLTFRSKRVSRKLTEEQRVELAERLKATRRKS